MLKLANKLNVEKNFFNNLNYHFEHPIVYIHTIDVNVFEIEVTQQILSLY